MKGKERYVSNFVPNPIVPCTLLKQLEILDLGVGGDASFYCKQTERHSQRVGMGEGVAGGVYGVNVRQHT